MTFFFLLVEDDPRRMELFRAWLPSWAHMVWEPRGAQAVELIRRDSGHVYGAVSLDYDLGQSDQGQRVSGLEVAAAIVDNFSVETPILIHSNDRFEAPKMARLLDQAGFWVSWMPFDQMTSDAFVLWLGEAHEIWGDLQGREEDSSTR